MSMLVFGKTGQVARELARRSPEARFVGRDEADLSDPASCAALIGELEPDMIINAAAYTAVDKAEEDEDLASLVNGAAPTAMAAAAQQIGASFVHISTDYVFDGSGQMPWKVTDAVGPIGAYGRSKLIGEEGVRSAGGAFAILRTSWVFSAHGNNFVKTMLRLGAERDRLTIVADQIGGPTPAAGIAETCLALAKALKTTPDLSGTYHYSGAPDVSWADFARAIFEQRGLTPEVVDIPSSEFPTPAKRPANSRMDCTSLEVATGIARPDWRDGLRAVLKDLETPS